MKKFNLLVLPYRDQYFMGRYGPSVRDLQIVCALSESEQVARVTALNRPVSVYERALNIKNTRAAQAAQTHSPPRLTWVDKSSRDLYGPLLRRKWLSRCYAEYGQETIDAAFSDDGINVFLDFSPIGVLGARLPPGTLYWYDLIDNFTRHNRYSPAERTLVENKYRHVQGRADFITGVSCNALSLFDRGMVVPNGVGIRRRDTPPARIRHPEADFGFIGFITDKFDCQAIAEISRLGYRINIFGEFYDESIRKNLGRMKNVALFGKFAFGELPDIIRSFKVGLIPYRRDKLHDESPLKLYQYLHAGNPVLASARFEIEDPSVLVYGKDGVPIEEACRHLTEMASDSSARERISSIVRDSDFWDHKASALLDELKKLRGSGPAP